MTTKHSENPIVDFSMLHDISGNDAGYMYAVLDIFLNNTPEGIDKLSEMVASGTDWEAIAKQAHFLKSSTAVVKIRDIYERLAKLEQHAKEERNIQEARQMMAQITATFREALPVIVAEKERNQR